MKNYVDEKQFKADVRRYAREHNIKGNEIGRLWQEIMLDDLLERISVSKYRDNFILKGGFLLSAIVGIDKRSTEDIYAEIKGLDLTEKQIAKVFEEICQIKLAGDLLSISLSEIEQIHEHEEYKDYRLHFNASFRKIRYPLKVDVSTGDVITPREIEYSYKLHIEDRHINIWAYTMETIVAEKLETVITRGIANTRMKDLYDLFILQRERINLATLKSAFANITNYRESIFWTGQDMDYKYCLRQVDIIAENSNMQNLWNRYVIKHPFAKGITFTQVIQAVQTWLTKLEFEK